MIGTCNFGKILMPKDFQKIKRRKFTINRPDADIFE